MYTYTRKLNCFVFCVQSLAYLTYDPLTFHVAVLEKRATVLKLLHRWHKRIITWQDSHRLLIGDFDLRFRWKGGSTYVTWKVCRWGVSGYAQPPSQLAIFDKSNSNMAPRLGGINQNKLIIYPSTSMWFPLFYSLKPRSQVWILIYRKWPISFDKFLTTKEK